jgi:hypothetical protein
VLVEDRGIDVIDAGRAHRDHLQVGQARADAIGEPIKADDRGLAAREVVDELVLLEPTAVGAELGAGYFAANSALSSGKKSK